jgi:hypothetical protein
VALVLPHLPEAGTVVVNGATLSGVLVRRDDDGWTLRDLSGASAKVADGVHARGWIRRYAPSDWDQGVRLGSHSAAVLSARLSLLGALMRSRHVDWVSTCDRLTAAENKLLQYDTASALGIRAPATVISGDPTDVAAALGEPFVVKPLGVAHFDADDGPKAVFAQEIRARDLSGIDILDAPFIMQELVRAESHLRVVTVGSRAWVCELPAAGLPIDWRREALAHGAFEVTENRSEVGRAGIELARALDVGYSSQDWIVDSTGACFVDLNPAGQWAFLPDPVPNEVARSIGQWLSGRQDP